MKESCILPEKKREGFELTWVVPLGVPQRDVGLGAELLLVDGTVQVVVDEVELRGLFADVVTAGRHADQVHLETQPAPSFKFHNGIGCF